MTTGRFVSHFVPVVCLALWFTNPGQAQVAEPGPSFWVDVEYLFWHLRNSPAPPPLATTGPNALFVNPPFPGALDNPGTTVVLGGSDLATPDRSGARFSLGYWFSAEQSIGLEGNYFFLAQRTRTLGVQADGTPLFTPFFDITPGVPAGESVGILSAPGEAGSAVLSLVNNLQGAELNGSFRLMGGGAIQLNLLAGLRYLGFHEALHFATTQRITDANNLFGIPPGEFANTLDVFDTRNTFYGGQIGAQLGGQWGNFVFRLSGKVALGNVHQKVAINGYSVMNAGPLFATLTPTEMVAGGVFALPSNIGVYKRDQFTVVPQVAVSVGYQIASWLRVFAGYDFLAIGDVVRPGKLIDRTINTTQWASFAGLPLQPLVGPARPGFTFADTQFWAQGVSGGIELRF